MCIWTNNGIPGLAQQARNSYAQDDTVVGVAWWGRANVGIDPYRPHRSMLLHQKVLDFKRRAKFSVL